MTEYRYACKDPNNYVTFNEELWRIIGLVNTPEGQRIKLIRYESIGGYSWDSSASTVNTGAGVNEWRQADIRYVLNEGHYYNRTKGVCYNGLNNSYTSCDFSNNGLLESSKEMIDTITWNTGAYNSSHNKSILISQFYNSERCNLTGKKCSTGYQCTDTVTRTTSWKGQVGLMYPSDYGYATSGGTTTNRETCFSQALYNWSNSSLNDCKDHNWLYTSELTWTLTPTVNADNNGTVAAIAAFEINQSGGVMDDAVAYGRSIKPSIYLKSNIKIIGGEGTKEHPYILQNNA